MKRAKKASWRETFSRFHLKVLPVEREEERVWEGKRRGERDCISVLKNKLTATLKWSLQQWSASIHLQTTVLIWLRRNIYIYGFQQHFEIRQHSNRHIKKNDLQHQDWDPYLKSPHLAPTSVTPFIPGSFIHLLFGLHPDEILPGRINTCSDSGALNHMNYVKKLFNIWPRTSCMYPGFPFGLKKQIGQKINKQICPWVQKLHYVMGIAWTLPMFWKEFATSLRLWWPQTHVTWSVGVLRFPSWSSKGVV